MKDGSVRRGRGGGGVGGGGGGTRGVVSRKREETKGKKGKMRKGGDIKGV